MRRLAFNAVCAYWAWVQAGLCAQAAAHGIAAGLLMLFMCFVSNRIAGAWITGK